MNTFKSNELKVKARYFLFCKQFFLQKKAHIIQKISNQDLNNYALTNGQPMISALAKFQQELICLI